MWQRDQRSHANSMVHVICRRMLCAFNWILSCTFPIEFVPKARQYTDSVRTFAYGTDASFYRLNPKLVVKVHTEEEIRRILPIAKKHAVPVTFRAAGTSLSGQALTDSVLIKISHTGKNFRNFTVHVSSLNKAKIVKQSKRKFMRTFF